MEVEHSDDHAIKLSALAKNEAMRKRLAKGKRTLCSGKVGEARGAANMDEGAASQGGTRPPTHFPSASTPQVREHR